MSLNPGTPSCIRTVADIYNLMYTLPSLKVDPRRLLYFQGDLLSGRLCTLDPVPSTFFLITRFMNVYPKFHCRRMPAMKFCLVITRFNERLPRISSPANAGNEILLFSYTFL